MRTGIASAVLALYSLSCTPKEADYPALTKRLEKLFPRFEELRLTAYRKQVWCSVLESKSGSFATNERQTCTYVAKNPTTPFTPEAEQQLSELSRAIDTAFSAVYIVDQVTYSPEGKLTHASFDFSAPFSRHSFVYEPGYTLPANMTGEMEFKPVDANWYYVWEDWN